MTSSMRSLCSRSSPAARGRSAAHSPRRHAPRPPLLGSGVGGDHYKGHGGGPGDGLMAGARGIRERGTETCLCRS